MAFSFNTFPGCVCIAPRASSSLTASSPSTRIALIRGFSTTSTIKTSLLSTYAVTSLKYPIAQTARISSSSFSASAVSPMRETKTFLIRSGSISNVPRTTISCIPPLLLMDMLTVFTESSTTEESMSKCAPCFEMERDTPFFAVTKRISKSKLSPTWLYVP